MSKIPLDNQYIICYTLIMDIKALRSKLKLTQKELAAKLGTTWGTISRWEHNRTKPSPLAQKAIESLMKKTGGY